MAEDKKELTKEERDAELQGRVEEFNKEFLPLLGKYQLGLGAVSFINPNGTIGARPIMFDARAVEEKKKEEGVGEKAAVTEA